MNTKATNGIPALEIDSKISRFITILIAHLSEKRCFSIPLPVVFCVVYFMIQAFSFSQFKTGGDIDTSEMLLYTQYWDWGYGGSQPPLYTWISLIFIEIFGLSLLTLSLLKFTMLSIAFVAVYAIARKIGLSQLGATSAMFGIFAIPEISWEAQRSLSHSAGLLAFCALGVLAFIQASQTRTLLAYSAFGLAVACAFLSKYNAVVLFAALTLSALLLPPWRQAILNWKFATALAVVAVLIAPHAFWAYYHPTALFARSSKFRFNVTGSVLTDQLYGLKSFINSNLSMLAIIIIIMVLTMARNKIAFQHLRLPKSGDQASLVVCTVLIALLIMWLCMSISGATSLPNRWLQPVLLFFPLVVAIAGTYLGNTDDSIRSGSQRLSAININQAAVGLILALSVLFALPLATVYSKKSRLMANQVNYRELQAVIKQSMGKVPSAILSDDYAYFSNLRLYQPNLKVIHPFIPDPIRLIDKPLVILWLGRGAMPEKTKALALSSGINVNRLITVNSRLVRADNPGIGRDFSFAYDPGDGT